MDVVLVNQTSVTTLDGMLHLDEADVVALGGTVAQFTAALARLARLAPGAEANLKLYGISLPRQAAVAPYEPTLRTQTARWVLAFIVPTSTSMQLFVKTMSGYTVTVTATPAYSMAELKRRIARKIGGGYVVDRLSYCSRELRDAATIGDYGLPQYATLTELPRLRGGSVGGPSTSVLESRPFVNLGDNKLLETVEFATAAPAWHQCSTAQRSRCGMQPFNLLVHQAKCPMCVAPVQAVTCGFHDCLWRFEGIAAATKMHMSSEWAEAAGGRYHQFAHCVDDIVQWQSLVLIAKPLEKADDCAVCCEPLASGATRKLPRCKHTFHVACATEWARMCALRNRRPSCPSCRTAYVK
ncbi:hypothetical protein SPRG_00574 [Saprolegnia parasitica CBS 223.65]|uniref:RING-type domain-containing protein n=1 Tax=Saprolegnia parasitica (strain CBS 223.65) TaxID=695850 RepID=A0A067D750_SAPPC|nr:hypothetical protein SPRG_00574 [Saprolegnia parasitica CBS 223.65]KDO34511.1 hypothetical protein SPRG_00574 [Saprolegnia parasitica CBS 223.65]|eukprot:XP_012194189.1 hypothetical protein SPRG_00574 [Saprolegnia parasitica CBS 223.65]